MTDASILWRRLDGPGHDACRVVAGDAGWQLEGTAVLLLDGRPAHLSYQLVCDGGWRTRRGSVSGWIGARAVNFAITCDDPGGWWTLDGKPIAGLEGCVDLDLGFTPATNLAQLRRLGLRAGEAADVPVAWLDVGPGTLDRLDQRYQRRSASTYWYEAPRFNYRGLLEVDDNGFARRYPGLWEAEDLAAD